MNDSRLIITGGAGFIGANLARHLRDSKPDAKLCIVDKLTYAGNKRYLEDVLDASQVTFVEEDIADAEAMARVFDRFDPTGVYHLAAEIPRGSLHRGPGRVRADQHRGHVRDVGAGAASLALGRS